MLLKSGLVCLGLLKAVSAAGLIKVPFTSTLVQGAGLSRRSTPNAPMSNAVLKVVTTVQAGNGQSFSNVLVDTGSAILWVGGQDKYVPGPNTRSMNATFSIGYGIGGANGTAYLDRVTIGAATANSQIIGAAEWVGNFKYIAPIDGILGLGPSGSNKGQVSGVDTTPTFVESLVAEGSIEKPIFGIYTNPLDNNGAQVGNGEITFGGVDQSRIRGDVTWVPQNPPFDEHWEFNATSFSWGDNQLTNGTIFSRTDTGVLSLEIPTDAFFAILHMVNGTIIRHPILDGYLTFPANATADSLPPIHIGISDGVFTIPPSRYLVPKSLYSTLNLTTDSVWSWISPAGPNAFYLGMKFLESVYSAYDMENNRVGFANLA